MNNFLKFKFLLIYLIVSFTLISSQAQSIKRKRPTEVKIEGAFAFTRVRDLLGLGIAAELRKKYKCDISLAAGLSYFNFSYPSFLNKLTQNGSQQRDNYNSTGAELMFYKGSDEGKLTSEIGLGIIGRYWSILNLQKFDNGAYSANIEKYMLIGYTTSIGLNYKLNSISKLSLQFISDVAN